jgi:hypothetical protein
VRELNRVAIEEGMGPLVSTPASGIEDISSATRLKLIFDTLTRSAYGYAAYAYQLQRVQQWPAARFIRHPGARQKRPLHEANENVVKLFDDVQWWISMNARSLGGFEVPWPPYGYNSWMDREPISRQYAISIGLIDDDYVPPSIDHPGFNDRISVDMAGVPWRLVKRLRKALKPRVTLSKHNLIFHPT